MNNTIIYPKLIGSFYSTRLNITNSWRQRARQKTKEALPWDKILTKCCTDDLQSVYKEFCHQELPNEIFKRKEARDKQRLELSKILSKLNVPYDIFIHTVPFTKFM